MLIFGTLSGIYIVPTIYQDYKSIGRLDGSVGEELVMKREENGFNNVHRVNIDRRDNAADKFAEGAIKEIRRKAVEHRRNMTVCLTSK